MGDGDSKGYYSAVINGLPYGRDLFINKKECRAHITKRMGTGLGKLGKNYKRAYCILAYGFPLRINGLNSM